MERGNRATVTLRIHVAYTQDRRQDTQQMLIAEIGRHASRWTR